MTINLTKKNFYKHIGRTKNILKGWLMRQISIEGRTAIFKSHTVFKVIQLLLLRSSSLLQLFHNYEKHENILSGRKTKHETNCNNFENGDSKM